MWEKWKKFSLGEKFGFGMIGCFGLIVLIFAGLLTLGSLINNQTSTSEEQISDKELNENKDVIETEKNSQSAVAAPTETDQTTQEINKEYDGIGDEVQIGDVAYKLDDVQTTDSIAGYTAAEGGMYIIVKLTVANLGNEAVDLSNSDFKLFVNKTYYSHDATTSTYNDNDDFSWVQINPGMQHTGSVVYEVPLTLAKEKVGLEIQPNMWKDEYGYFILEEK